MAAGEWFLAAAAILGHAAFWLGFICRLHAIGWPCQLLKAIDWVWLTVLVALPTLAGVTWLQGTWAFLIAPNGIAPALVQGYAWFCVAFFVLAFGLWIRERSFVTPIALASNHTQAVELLPLLNEPASEHPVAGWLLKLPLNESLRIDVNVKMLSVPRLPAELDGLSIVHLSDLHLTGKLRPAFYREVVRLANELDADLVAVTGDIVENVECLDWLNETLGQLRARHGVYFILGNHDRRLPDVGELRKRLGDLGWIDLANCWRRVAMKGGEVLLAGNELPWFAHAADFLGAPPSRTASAQDGLFRILLAHSPDQLAWARERDCDLLLAGHMHGGQFVLPFIGPILAPSWHGTYYSAGIFDEPPTLMHVSRGVAALHPFRFNAPPEITKLVLRSVG